MRAELHKPLALFLAVAAVAILIGVVGQRVLGVATGPEAELITQLKKLERTGVELELPGVGLLRLPTLQYQRIQVHVQPGGTSALVTCTLDATGDLKGGATVSSLGLERIPYVLEGGDWVRPKGPAPRLAAIVTALERRRLLLEAGGPFPDGVGQGEDLERLRALEHRRFQARAWYIRSEREEVLVSEDYEVSGDLPERPVQDRGTRRLTLVEDTTGEFRFPADVR